MEIKDFRYTFSDPLHPASYDNTELGFHCAEERETTASPLFWLMVESLAQY